VTAARRHRPLNAALLIAAFALHPGAAFGYALDHLQTLDDIGPNKVPNQGTSRVLVILQRSFGEGDPDRYEQLVNFYNPEGGPGTFRTFWNLQSKGAYDPIATVVDPLIYDECIVPGIDPEACRLSLDDMTPLLNGALHASLTRILEDVRERDGLDLREFDVNGPGCELGMTCPDGWIDGLVIDTDAFGGLAFPLAALAGPVTVDARVSGDGAPTDDELVQVGIVALTPPARHEFAHNLGFIDSYNGPTLNGLMAWTWLGLSAYSRLQIGWATDIVVDTPQAFTLPPVLAGGDVLRIGERPRFLLIENRGGPEHELWNRSPPGINIYAVDEEQLPDTELGFLDILAGDLYFPNQTPPYFNINLPLGCTLDGEDDGCVLGQAGQFLELEHPITGPTGWWLVVESIAADGTTEVRITDEEPSAPPVDAGAPVADDGGEGGDGNGDTDGGPDDAPTCLCAQPSSGGAWSAMAILGLVATALTSSRRRRRAGRAFPAP
jgi:hypothetical protein